MTLHKDSYVISKYLDKAGKKIEMFDKVELSTSSKAVLNNMSKMNMDLNSIMNIVSEDTKNTYPTYEKCVAIRNWICNM